MGGIPSVLYIVVGGNALTADETSTIFQLFNDCSFNIPPQTQTWSLDYAIILVVATLSNKLNSDKSCTKHCSEPTLHSIVSLS